MLTFETDAYVMRSKVVSNTALTLATIGFSGQDISNVRAMLVTVDTQPLRFAIDGSTPTATSGHYVPIGLAPFRIEGAGNCKAFQVIRATGVDGAITITLESDLG